jgi:hypothetical protein
MRYLIGICLMAGLVWAQPGRTTAVSLQGKPPCSATVTANCIQQVDAAGKAIGGPVSDDGTTLSVTGRNVAIGPTLLPVPATIAVSSPQSPTATGFVYNNTAGALTVNLPALTTGNLGIQLCIENDTGRTGAITLQLPAATTISVDGVAGTAGGTLVSGGSLGDRVCVVGKAAGKYMGYVGSGTWTKS